MPTLAEIGNIRGHSTAETRWAKFGPYYAMFPIDFAFKTVERYSNEGDYILDPFAGRFSSTYAGGVLGRHSIGIEINPIGWLYGKTKLNPAPQEKVVERLHEIYEQRNKYSSEAKNLNEFFQLCFCQEVLKFLLSARENLNWKQENVDSTLMSILLVHLHGKLGEGLSNQMRQTKAMGFNYSINWWKTKGYINPPEYNPLKFITRKIHWRYAKQTPRIANECVAILGDSTIELPKLVEKSKKQGIKYKFLFTSPPYHSVVDYHIDQWLRLWLLREGADKPQTNSEKHKGRFHSKEDYRELLDRVFCSCAEIMDNEGVIFVRTDVRIFTYNLTVKLLREYFPEHLLTINESEVIGRNQTELFNNKSKKKEIDIKLEPRTT